MFASNAPQNSSDSLQPLTDLTNSTSTIRPRASTYEVLINGSFMYKYYTRCGGHAACRLYNNHTAFYTMFAFVVAYVLPQSPGQYQ